MSNFSYVILRPFIVGKDDVPRSMVMVAVNTHIQTELCTCMQTMCMFNKKVAKAIDLECIGNDDYLNRPHKQTHRFFYTLYHIMEMCLSIVIFYFFASLTLVLSSTFLLYAKFNLIFALFCFVSAK